LVPEVETEPGCFRRAIKEPGKELAMSLFKKKDDHVGSGIDKPKAKGIVKKLLEAVKPAAAPKPAMPPKNS
jgi:hypothetical protein